MRRVAELGFLLMIVVISAALTRQPIGLETPVELRGTFTRDQAIALVAHRAGLEVVGKLEGEVDLDLPGASAHQALDRIVGRDEWKLVGRQLLLIPVRRVREVPDGFCSFEMGLEKADVHELLPLLTRLFPCLDLTPHPTFNGFFPIGSRRDVLDLKNLIPQLDEIAPPNGVVTIHPMIEDHQILLEVKREFPQATFAKDHLGLAATAPLETLVELVDRADMLGRTPRTVAISSKLEPGCRFDLDWDGYHVPCSPGCQGPLHQLGLEPGDILTLGWTRLERAQPRWRLTRGQTKLLLDLTL